MTTSKGSHKINIGFNKNKNEHNELNEFFSPGFINRIDSIINFNYLNKKDILSIIKLELNNIKKKYNNIHINLNTSIINEILDESNYQEFGARKIPKIIENKLEGIIIDKIIDNKKEINIDSIFV